jgi:hypothetical protein
VASSQILGASFAQSADVAAQLLGEPAASEPYTILIMALSMQEERENACEAISDRFGKDVKILQDKLEIEEKQRGNERDHLQSQIDKLVKNAKETKEDLQAQLDKEQTEREKQAKEMDEYFKYVL